MTSTSAPVLLTVVSLLMVFLVTKASVAIGRLLPTMMSLMICPVSLRVTHLTSRLTPSQSLLQLRRHWLQVATNRCRITLPAPPIISGAHRSTPRDDQSVTTAVTTYHSSVDLMATLDHRGYRLAGTHCYTAMDCLHYSTELPAYWRLFTTVSRTCRRVLRLPIISAIAQLFTMLLVLRRRRSVHGRRRHPLVRVWLLQQQHLYSLLSR